MNLENNIKKNEENKNVCEVNEKEWEGIVKDLKSLILDCCKYIAIRNMYSGVTPEIDNGNLKYYVSYFFKKDNMPIEESVKTETYNLLIKLHTVSSKLYRVLKEHYKTAYKENADYNYYHPEVIKKCFGYYSILMMLALQLNPIIVFNEKINDLNINGEYEIFYDIVKKLYVNKQSIERLIEDSCYNFQLNSELLKLYGCREEISDLDVNIHDSVKKD